MNGLYTPLVELVVAWGPGFLFLLAAAETCFVTGLFVPAGMATALATVLAAQGTFGYVEVAVAALAGGWLGDVLGFGIGRRWGERLERGSGRWARLYRRRRARASAFLRRHPVYSVTVARMVAFVRTLAPMAAGSGGLPLRTFLMYEAPGVLGSTLLYVGIGALAGESWQRVGSLVAGGWMVVFALGGLGLWLRRRGGSGSGQPGAGTSGGAVPGTTPRGSTPAASTPASSRTRPADRPGA